ncbi:hypothetical protein F5Y06DRAFT_131966 [Hypoxylon sp. FL0890]|nr:hypothetical protein F5Y06DRAFT_131966 [Hypoxylon sp. FL0890]
MSGIAALAAALPKCAATCILTAVESSTCAITNQTCICYDGDLNAKATTCINANCTIREALFTKNLTSTSCGLTPATNSVYIPIDITFITLAAISVLLRVVARLQMRVPMWWDDFTITLSFLGCVAFTAIAFKSKSHGFGTDMWAVPFDGITFVFKALYTLFLLYITIRHFVRLSILFFYHRIFGHIPLAKRLIRITVMLFIACCISFDFVILFGCTPLDYFWTGWDGQHEGHCISINFFFWAGAFIDIAMDIWVILIPLPFIARMNLSLRKKVCTGIMFAFGILVIIISLYRLSTINHFTLSKNPTADFIDVGIWSGLEIYVGITCACLPNFHYLLKPMNAWLSSLPCCRTRSLRPAGSDPSNAGGHSGYLDKTKLGSERATTVTTVDGRPPASESQTQLSSSAWGDITESVDIELGVRNTGGTSGTAWS